MSDKQNVTFNVSGGILQIGLLSAGDAKIVGDISRHRYRRSSGEQADRTP